MLQKPVCFSRLNVAFSLLMMIPVLFALVVMPAPNATACEGEGGLTGIGVLAPLDADANCTATPPTISVLGLTIDISKATLGGGWEHWEHHGAGLSCTDLTKGKVVSVQLASDTPATGTMNLSATQVALAGGDDDDYQPPVMVNGPFQAVNTTANTVQILGLTIDFSKATLKSNDDEAPTASQLAVGQFASAILDPSVTTTTPLPNPLPAIDLFFDLVEVKVQAPLDALPDCTAMTVSVLGLTVDISKATLSKGYKDSATFTCADLTANQVVKLTLASDVPDPTTKALSATEVEISECDCSCHQADVKITAPLVAITTDTATPPNTTVTVLGTLVVDITNAILVADEDSPFTLQDLMLNQFVTLILPSNQTPLKASMVWAQTPASHVDFEVFDWKGHRVNDGDVHDVNAAVTVTKARNKVVTLRTTSNGSFSVASAPSGQAKVVVTRVNSGTKGKATNLVTVKAKTTKNVHIFLKQVAH